MALINITLGVAVYPAPALSTFTATTRPALFITAVAVAATPAQDSVAVPLSWLPEVNVGAVSPEVPATVTL